MCALNEKLAVATAAVAAREEAASLLSAELDDAKAALGTSRTAASAAADDAAQKVEEADANAAAVQLQLDASTAEIEQVRNALDALESQLSTAIDQAAIDSLSSIRAKADLEKHIELLNLELDSFRADEKKGGASHAAIISAADQPHVHSTEHRYADEQVKDLQDEIVRLTCELNRGSSSVALKQESTADMLEERTAELRETPEHPDEGCNEVVYKFSISDATGNAASKRTEQAATSTVASQRLTAEQPSQSPNRHEGVPARVYALTDRLHAQESPLGGVASVTQAQLLSRVAVSKFEMETAAASQSAHVVQDAEIAQAESADQVEEAQWLTMLKVKEGQLVDLETERSASSAALKDTVTSLATVSEALTIAETQLGLSQSDLVEANLKVAELESSLQQQRDEAKQLAAQFAQFLQLAQTNASARPVSPHGPPDKGPNDIEQLTFRNSYKEDAKYVGALPDTPLEPEQADFVAMQDRLHAAEAKSARLVNEVRHLIQRSESAKCRASRASDAHSMMNRSSPNVAKEESVSLAKEFEHQHNYPAKSTRARRALVAGAQSSEPPLDAAEANSASSKTRVQEQQMHEPESCKGHLATELPVQEAQVVLKDVIKENVRAEGVDTVVRDGSDDELPPDPVVETLPLASSPIYFSWAELRASKSHAKPAAPVDDLDHVKVAVPPVDHAASSRLQMLKLCRERRLDYKAVTQDVDGLRGLLVAWNDKQNLPTLKSNGSNMNQNNKLKVHYVSPDASGIIRAPSSFCRIPRIPPQVPVVDPKMHPALERKRDQHASFRSAETPAKTSDKNVNLSSLNKAKKRLF